MHYGARIGTVGCRVGLCAILLGGLAWLGCQKDSGGKSEQAGQTGQEETGAEAGAPVRAQPPASKGTADAKSAEVAGKVMDALGGERAWNQTRYISWKFMGNRQHYWDKDTGNLRIEANDVVILMNLHTGRGSVRKAGQELVDSDAIASYLERGHGWWINDSYWMFMPFKLRDPGVDLVYAGEQSMADGRPVDVLTVTFEGVGLTPRNKYDVYVDRESRLVVKWSYYQDRDDAEPQLTAPWTGWTEFGKIKLATQHGRGLNWDIHVYDRLPASVFESFDPVDV